MTLTFKTVFRSLNKNFDLVDEIFPSCTKLPDILSFTETKLNEYKQASEIPGYKFERSDDSVTKSGGVGVYISNHLDYSLRSDLSMNLGTCEDLWIDIRQGGSNKKSGKRCSNIVVGVIYRHPTQNCTKFCDKLCKTLNILNKSKTDYMIVGDFDEKV